MSTSTINITISSDMERISSDIKAVSDSIVKFAEDFKMIRANALKLALSSSSVAGAVKERTPMSNKERYMMQKDGKARAKPPRNMVHGTLRRGFGVQITKNSADEVNVEVGVKGVEYAARMHALEVYYYWSKSNFYGGGWSMAKSGNEFIKQPLENASDKIAEDVVKVIDSKIVKDVSSL